MHNPSVDRRVERIFYWALAGALVLGVLAGVFLPRITAQAQSMEPQTYTVLAGDGSFYNTQVLAFAPQSLQIHRGDTVLWRIAGGFHNVHFEEQLTPLVIAPEVNGAPLPQLNPALMFPTIMSGAVYQGGDANSGLSLDEANPGFTFSLVMDLDTGIYSYLCDLHPGMVGTITVADDATAIPSPAEALAAGVLELEMAGGQAVGAAMGALMQPPAVDENGVLHVSAGLQTGSAHTFGFFPPTAVIEAGQSVTWTVQDNSQEPHFVAWPVPTEPEFEPVMVEGGPPMIALAGSFYPSVENGAEIGSGDSFNSGVLFPPQGFTSDSFTGEGLAGQSFTLTFTEPGVYNYLCFVHPGMNGVVVVMPAM